jgi:hypothetical protein
MRWLLAFAVGLAIASVAGSCTAESTSSPVSAGTLLYLDQPKWSQADGSRKVAIAADFMRVFCGNPGMPALDLVDCLDRSADTEPLFERALSCIAERQR